MLWELAKVCVAFYVVFFVMPAVASYFFARH